MTRVTTTPNRRWLLWLLIGTAVALIAGHVVPPLIINLMKLQDTGVSATYRAEPAEARLLDVAALLDGEPTAGNAGLPECVDGEAAPLSCFQATGPARVERTTATAPAEDFIEADVSSLITVDVGGEVVLEIDDDLRISRDSNFPVPEPRAQTTITAAPVEAEIAGVPHVREGLQYFFPFNTERRSYLYFDALAQAPTPIDYVGETEVSDLDAWEFSQTIETVDLARAADRATDGDDARRRSPAALAGVFSGPAERFYTPAERATRGLAADAAVALTPYYAVDRTVFVEPDTGTVLDAHAEWHVYLAADEEDAAALIAAADGRAHPLRTLFHSATSWDDETRTMQEEKARPQLAVLRGLQILAWVANAVALALIAALVVLVVRSRDRRSRSLTAPAEL